MSNPPIFDSCRIAKVTSAALQAIVPTGFVLEEQKGDIVVSIGNEWSGTIGLRESVEALAEQEASVQSTLEGVMESVLLQLQEMITREERMPWPSLPGPGVSSFAAAQTAVVDGCLLLEYGTRDLTVVSVSIPLSSLGLVVQE